MNSKPEGAEEAEVGRDPRAPLSLESAITDRIIGAAIEVHRHLGPGLMESAYEECLCYEMSRLGLRFERQVHLPVVYKGLKLDCGYRMDLVVEGAVIVEIKAIDQLLPIHSAQLLTYLKASGKSIGLLINFNVSVLRQGLKRIANRYTERAGTARTSASSATEPQGDATASSSSDSLRSPLRLSASAVKTGSQ